MSEPDNSVDRSDFLKTAPAESELSLGVASSAFAAARGAKTRACHWR